MPTMPADRVLAAYLYYDAAVDDARLVLTVARTAAAHGAAVANGCAVVDVTHDADGASTVWSVEADGRRFDDPGLRGRQRRRRVERRGARARRRARPRHIRPAKGVHVTVPWSKVRNDIAVVIPVPKDKRSLFVVPWGPNGDGTFRHSTSAPPTPTTPARSTTRSAPPTTSPTCCAP
jgi:glycerol-3-phosphate dehydrogenase